jgi:thymidylate synthase
VHTLGDAHIYHNHFDQIQLQLSREPRELPILRLNTDKSSVFEFEMADIQLENYNPHGRIKAPVAV